MKIYKPALLALFISSASVLGTPLLFLKGDRLYQTNGGAGFEYITNGVTKVAKGTSMFLKNDRLYRATDGGNYEYITQQVTEICDDARYFVKQSSRLYVLGGGYEAEYITAGVTSCN